MGHTLKKINLVNDVTQDGDMNTTSYSVLVRLIRIPASNFLRGRMKADSVIY